MQHGRCRLAAARFRRVLFGTFFVVDQRRGAVHDPDAIVVVDRNARHLSQNPIVGQWLGPERLNNILRWPAILCRNLDAAEGKDGGRGREHHSIHRLSSKLSFLSAVASSASQRAGKSAREGSAKPWPRRIVTGSGEESSPREAG